MTKKNCLFLLFIVTIIFYACEKKENSFTYIIAADMRYTAKEEFRDSRYFQGVCEAIKKYGKGSFMISPGDIDPPSAVYEVISQVLGEDYPWYPVVGNHELDDIENMVYLRAYNENGNSLPNIVRTGPSGSVETTYSFDWGDNHFIVLNQYYDGQSDMGTDGDIVPQLLEWLQKDLSETEKKYIFVFGHEPLIAIPDMDNGRLRHQYDSLNKYPKSSFQFHQWMKKFKVTAYICGHTHNTSIAKINGIWQIDAGHARGIEAFFPTMVVEGVSEKIKEGQKKGLGENESLAVYFKDNAYEAKKVLYYSNLTEGISYRIIDDTTALNIFSLFYKRFSENVQLRDKYKVTFWERANLARSTFLKVITRENDVTVEFYRDDARGGEYNLMYSYSLN